METLTALCGRLMLCCFGIIVSVFNSSKGDIRAFLRRFELLNELLEWGNEVFNQLEFVVVHIRRQVKVRLSWTDAIELNRVLVRDQGVFLTMKEEDWAFCF